MISLTQLPALSYVCPDCGADLRADGWYIPGMRNLASLKCEKCAGQFYGDLPTGHGIDLLATQRHYTLQPTSLIFRMEKYGLSAKMANGLR